MNAIIVELRDLHESLPAKSGRIEVKTGDRVLVSTPNGLEAATVIEPDKEVNDKKIEIEIIRYLNDDDYRVLKENKRYACKMLPDVTKAIKEEKLDMKLAGISYTYDRQKLFIYYTANSRVDFRKLIRVLGAKLKVRVQMVQIGVRDKASIVGGLGVCGREICCHKFLRNIESVNIDMARTQQISLNPENISGCCGRLLCCLRYENEFYEEMNKILPQVGSKVHTPEGKGDVISLNHIKGTVTVKLKTGAINEFKVEDVKAGVKMKFGKWKK
jgi:cell fate regulator YaaT (PSP1 superfamily)